MHELACIRKTASSAPWLRPRWLNSKQPPGKPPGNGTAATPHALDFVTECTANRGTEPEGRYRPEARPRLPATPSIQEDNSAQAKRAFVSYCHRPAAACEGKRERTSIGQGDRCPIQCRKGIHYRTT